LAFQAEAVELVLAVGLILNIDREVEDNRVSLQIAVTVKHLQVNILVAVVRNPAVFVQGAAEDSFIGPFWELIQKHDR
jgi:hypothetical protein